MADASPQDAAGEPAPHDTPSDPAGSPSHPGLAAARPKPNRGEAATTPRPAPDVDLPPWMVPPLGPVTTRMVLLRLVLLVLVLVAAVAIASVGFVLIRQISGDDATRNWSLTVAGNSHLTLSTGRGDVVVEGAPREIGDILADISYADRVTFENHEQDGANSLRADIDDPLLTRWFGTFKPDASFAGVVTARASLLIETGSGRLQASGMQNGGELHGRGGPVILRDAAGNWTIDGRNIDVEGTRIAGSLRVTSSDGDVVLDSITGDVTIETDDGNLRLSNLGSAVTLSTTDGDIAVDVAAGPVDISTGDGDVAIRTRIPAGSQNRIHTGDGDIVVKLDGAPDVAIVVSAPRGTVTVNGQPVGPRFEQTMANGSARLEIVADDGNVDLSFPTLIEVQGGTPTP